jgi:hypothetical protein
MGIVIASKILNSYNSNKIAAFLTLEFNCTVSREDVDLAKASRHQDDNCEIESKKVQYYGSVICDD